MPLAMAEMLEAVGCTNIGTYTANNPPGHCIHEMGGARMSKTKEEGVVDKNNALWDAPNLFVTDGACMASNGCQNPSITYMAFTARAVDLAVKAINRREL